jgi:hypothetical protein
VLAVLGAVGVLPVLGCGTKRVPVAGSVTLEGEPLRGGILTFSPDAGKGNTARVSCTGPVRAGRYEVRTSGVGPSDSGTGVPPGWYKVTLLTGVPGQPAVEVNRMYTSEETTPLSVEVVASPPPGHYDFQLKK